MFLPPLKSTIIIAFALLLTCQGSVLGQRSEYERRLAAMHEARGRGGEAYQEFNSGVRVADNSNQYSASPRTNTVQASQPARSQASQAPARTTGASLTGRYSNNRVAQLHDQPLPAGGSPVVQNGIYESVVADGGYSEGCYDGNCGMDQCGDGCGYFQCGACSGRGLCPPGDCWLQGLGGILVRGDYFFGAQGFQTPMFFVPGTQNQLNHDGNFGFYGGFNLGVPLCRLTCGLFAGQFGLRSVQSNFGGNEFTTDSRDQLFMTAGLFRRVDYGFQGGVAFDFMWDNWFTNSQVSQMRTDLGYLWAGGTSFGFRYHTNLNDDLTSGVIRGQTIDNIFTTTEDSYRFYLRHEACSGGYGELFAGWTDSDQTILGGEIDVPITEMLATQAGVTYYLDDTVPPTASNRLGGYVNEAWNIYAGFSFRPCGRSYYRNYDRPFFNVADNGSMLIRRN